MTFFTRNRRCSPSWNRLIHSTPSHTTPTSILILSYHLRPGLSQVAASFQVFQPKALYEFLYTFMRGHAPPIDSYSAQ
jgi:hypothetical protein